MHPLLKPLWALYYWIVFVPLFLVLTILTALVTIIETVVAPRHSRRYVPARLWSRATMALLWSPVTVRGGGKLPEGALLVAPTHASALDVFVMAGFFPRSCRWMLKASLRRIPLVGAACARIGFLYVDHTPSGARRIIAEAETTLEAGESILMFPEGTRSTTGRLGRLQKGAAGIALATGVPLLPCRIEGTFEALPRGRVLVRPRRITLTILPPIPVDGCEEGPRGVIDLNARLAAALSGET